MRWLKALNASRTNGPWKI